MMKLRFVASVLIAVFFWPALAIRGADKKSDVNEIGNRRVARRAMISQEKEIGIGKQYATEIDRSAKILTDPVVNEYVNRLAQNLARNSDLTIPLTVKVLDSPEINAFALPGAFMYVNTGLLLAAEEEDQVAGVLAHEIAHVAARHWASQMTKSQIANIAQIPLMIFTGGLSYPIWYGVWNAYGFVVPLTFLKFSRGAEAEADFLGLQYMYKAGYDPSAYVSFFGKIIDQDRRSPGSVPTVFASHPPTPERILKSEETIKEILPKRDQYLVTTSEFDDIKSRLQIVISRKKQDRPGGPTLRKREATDPTTTQGQPQEQGKDEAGEKPPVLRRRE